MMSTTPTTPSQTPKKQNKTPQHRLDASTASKKKKKERLAAEQQEEERIKAEKRAKDAARKRKNRSDKKVWAYIDQQRQQTSNMSMPSSFPSTPTPATPSAGISMPPMATTATADLAPIIMGSMEKLRASRQSNKAMSDQKRKQFADQQLAVMESHKRKVDNNKVMAIEVINSATAKDAEYTEKALTLLSDLADRDELASKELDKKEEEETFRQLDAVSLARNTPKEQREAIMAALSPGGSTHGTVLFESSPLAHPNDSPRVTLRDKKKYLKQRPVSASKTKNAAKYDTKPPPSPFPRKPSAVATVAAASAPVASLPHHNKTGVGAVGLPRSPTFSF